MHATDESAKKLHFTKAPAPSDADLRAHAVFERPPALRRRTSKTRAGDLPPKKTSHEKASQK